MIKKVNKPYSKYLLDAIKCIKQHIDNNPFHYKTASELIENFIAPNRTSLEKAFKEVYGAGIKEYQVKQRLEAATKYLETGMNKKQVASKCYYSSHTAFSRAFKREFGITPTEWQRRYG